MHQLCKNPTFSHCSGLTLTQCQFPDLLEMLVVERRRRICWGVEFGAPKVSETQRSTESHKKKRSPILESGIIPREP